LLLLDAETWSEISEFLASISEFLARISEFVGAANMPVQRAQLLLRD